MPPPRLATQSSTATTASSSTTTLEHSATLPLRQSHGTLILRAEPAEQRRIQWAEDVVDNEGMGKKSSKVCCIYHRPHAVDESSGDESSSDSSSDSDSDSGGDDGRARPVGGSRRAGRKGHKHHDHDHDHGDDKENGSGKGKARKKSPNAYEKQPSYGKKALGGGEGGP